MVFDKPVFEQGPIRPPSEAESLLVRLTRNCPWNKCLFCPVYKGEQFSRRTLFEITEDIEAIAAGAEEIKAISKSLGFKGHINRQVVLQVQSDKPELLQVAFWLFRGGRNVFLQDGDSLLLPVDVLEEILILLREKFPTIDRITSYARSKTILRRTLADLIRLRKVGLNRIHVGLESGSDTVLSLMKKGVTGKEHVEAGLRVKAAEISLSEYVMPGLGGKQLWREHAAETAAVLNQINPDFIRLRTLAVPRSAPLYEKVSSGEFLIADDKTVVNELLLFIENLDGINSRIYSDHILNLFEELDGVLPDEKESMLDLLRSYLNLPKEKQELYRLGRRTGYLRRLEDLKNPDLLEPVLALYRDLAKSNLSTDDYIRQLMQRYI